MYVRDHNSMVEPTNVIKPGDLFGEVALLCGCKRTASVKTNNYSTLASLDKHAFRDMCHQYVDVREKLKQNLKSYTDKLKMFLKFTLKSIPFMRNLSDEAIEEVTYHLKQKYVDENEIIYRAGEKVDKIYLITRGEVDLLVNIQAKDFVIHRLYQG